MNLKFLLLLSVCIISIFHCVPRVLGTPIFGGFKVKDNRFNHHVSLHRINFLNAYEYFCGGTIIHEKYILTAAHCFVTIVWKSRFYYIGVTTDLVVQRPKIIAGTKKREGRGIERDITAIFVPRHYQTSPVHSADIAVVQLIGNLDVASSKGKLAMMPLGDLLPDDQANKEAIFCGFGYYRIQRGEASKVFSTSNQYLPVTLLHESVCPEFDSENICALASDRALEDGDRTACNGDDGAGLIFGEQIVGVYSNGPTTCIENILPPMRFTRILRFKAEIVRAMQEDADHSDMHVWRKTLDPAGSSNPHNKESSNRGKKGVLAGLSKFFNNKSSTSSS